MNWIIVVQSATALYLIVGGLIINAPNLPSKFLFKVVPVILGMLLAFASMGHILDWPIG